MRRRAVLVPLLVSVLVATGIGAITVAQAAGTPGSIRQIAVAGTTNLGALPVQTGSDAIQVPEFRPGIEESSEGGEPPAAESAQDVVDRSLSDASPPGVSVASTRRAKSTPEVTLSFDGLNHRDQRLANGGNQFSVEPPDQALCVGGGFVLESLNQVLRVYDSSGNPLSGVIDQNTFYGYPPAINRTPPVAFGPFITDPICHFDPDTKRFYHVVLTLDVFPANGAFTGRNHLDIAVSNTSDPTGTWTIYRLPVQNDGTEGTPDHNCAPGSPPPTTTPTNPEACIGDFPHLGVDRNGFYLTTNEYDLFGPAFHGAQIYAFDKFALASGAASVAVTQFDTSGPTLGGQPGFTVWPAITPGSQYSDAMGGTEFFLSSMAAEEATGTPGGGTADTIGLWALSNTSSLLSASPSLTLRNVVLDSLMYGIPPKSNQKPGDFPLGQCLNDNTIATPFGTGCWRFFFVSGGPFNEVESHLDSSDTRMMQVSYANGKVWGSLDTVVNVGGTDKAGIAYFVVKPNLTTGTLAGDVALQGYVSLAGNNLTYPTVSVTQNGRGIMSFTVVGADHYPSVGYVPLDAAIGAGDIRIVKEGLGPSDGFTSYKAFVGDPPRTRWGDYGAAAVAGKNIWFGTEYIAQTCTLTQYLTGAIGSCGATRTSLGNWATRITKVSLAA